jgi:hypothetical protein
MESMTGPRRSPQTDPPPPSRATIHQTWWPRADTVEAASRVARYGFWAATINAALSALLLYMLLDVGAAVPVPATQVMIGWAAADLAISVAVAIGMWFYRPGAAVAGLLLFVASKSFGWLVAAPQPNLTAILIAALFAYFYVLGVRGAFARRRLLAGGGGSARR